MTDEQEPVDELARFEPFVNAVIDTWTSKGVVEVAEDKRDELVEELKHAAGDAETPYKMLKALAKQVEASECVEEYYASREELIDLIRDLASG
jgi:hypothetical protein